MQRPRNASVRLCRRRASRIADTAKYAAYQIAEVYAWRGQKDLAFQWLERAYTQHDGGLTEIKTDPLLASLHADPRYQAFMRKMKLSP
jgi:hypothetical protein